MGLTESNHSKATNTGCTGPSKSRSTPHFPDGRGYQNRPRQASTLPARPTPDSVQPPPYHHPRTPVRDPHSIGHDPRPPETERPCREGSLQAGRSPNFRPVIGRRSASADSRKRRSDPLLDARTLKQLPQINHERGSVLTSVSHTDASPPTSPRLNQRPRPTAIYVEDDQPTRVMKQREGRSRDRSAATGKSRSGQKAESRDRSRGSGERRQRPTHVSTFTMTPHFPEDSLSSSSSQIHPSSHQKHKRTSHRSSHRAEFIASDNLHGDPYVCLHYGGTMKDGQRKPIQQITAWKTELAEEPPNPDRQMSQVIIHMNQVSATTLDNYDAVNANIESVQVRRNVWFQASRAIGHASEPPVMRKISSKAMRTPSICSTTSGYSSSDFIQWPDVTNKVSSLYMKPERHVAAVPCIKEEKEFIRKSTVQSAGSQTESRVPASLGSVNCARDGNTVSSRHQVSNRMGSENKEMISVTRQLYSDEIRNSDWSSHNFAEEREVLSSMPESESKHGKVRDPDMLLPPSEFSDSNCTEEYTYENGSLSASVPEEGKDENFVSEEEKTGLELNFGINNHVEDYTVIEATSNTRCFYGCRDSDHETDEASSCIPHHSLLSCKGQLPSSVKHGLSLECDSTVDNLSLAYDKADKKLPTDDITSFVDSSLFVDGVSLVPDQPLTEEVTKDVSNSVCKKTFTEGRIDDFYKKQLALVSDYLSLRDQLECKIEGESDIYTKAFSSPGRSSYPADTVPGSPSALAFSQKCLTHSASLPRQLRTSSSATVDSGNTENMKGFRNRLRSFDLGHFPVLRLPLGNQPRLVEVLRAATSRSQEQEYTPAKSMYYDEGIHSTGSASSEAVRGTLVSYSDSDSSFHPDKEINDFLSKNSISDERIQAVTLPEVQQVSYAQDDPEEDLSDEGCDEGTIKRRAIRDLARENSSALFCDVAYSNDGSSCSRDHEGRSKSVSDETTVQRFLTKENEVVTSLRHTWQGNTSSRGHDMSVGAYRLSNGVSEDTYDRRSPDVTLRHPEKAHLLFNDKRRSSNPQDSGHYPPTTRHSSDSLTSGAIPDIVPPFNKHIRKKHANRRSLHSIDWDTPLPPVPLIANTDCNYTCHEQCQDLVTLDCKADLTPDSQTSEEDLYVDTDQGTLVKHENLSNQNLNVTTQEDEEEEENEEDDYEEQEEKHEEEQQEKELLEEPSKWNEEISTLRKSVNQLQSYLVDNETLEAWVEKYNATSQGLQIAKESDGSYRGCIRVHLNLSRPINIVAGTRPPSIYDILQEDRTMEKTLTSFYMPRDAVKAIHITSKTTTREVIIALLRKFKVVDNPQKFALYERTYDAGQPGKAKLRRLGDSECPLVLAINWSAGGLTNKRLVLQENDTADIQWEAFSLPELSNFLRILDREEEEYRCQIKDKYALLRRRIGNMLMQNPPSAAD